MTLSACVAGRKTTKLRPMMRQTVTAAKIRFARESAVDAVEDERVTGLPDGSGVVGHTIHAIACSKGGCGACDGPSEVLRVSWFGRPLLAPVGPRASLCRRKAMRAGSLMAGSALGL